MARRENKLFAKTRMIEPAPVASVPVAAASAGIAADVVAAIAGAVAVICGEGATIASIRPAARRGQSAGRSAWSAAGLLENTSPF